jgi:hypothetical protein
VSKSKVIALTTVSLIAFVLSSFHTVSAQSTVFNIPSTDVQTSRRLYVEADFLTHASSFERGGFQLYGTRLVFGLSKRAEAGVNVYFINTAPAEPIEIQPNFKFRLYQNEEKGLAIATGAAVFLPISHRSLSSSRAMVYAVGSKKVNAPLGPRFSLGAYNLIGTFEKGTSKRGVLLGYEQPITRKLTVVADWSSGNNDYGYVVAGAGITLSPKSVLYVGYNVGNQGRGNNSLGIFYGYSF